MSKTEEASLKKLIMTSILKATSGDELLAAIDAAVGKIKESVGDTDQNFDSVFLFTASACEKLKIAGRDFERVMRRLADIRKAECNLLSAPVIDRLSQLCSKTDLASLTVPAVKLLLTTLDNIGLFDLKCDIASTLERVLAEKTKDLRYIRRTAHLLTHCKNLGLLERNSATVKLLVESLEDTICSYGSENLPFSRSDIQCLNDVLLFYEEVMNGAVIDKVWDVVLRIKPPEIVRPSMIQRQIFKSLVQSLRGGTAEEPEHEFVEVEGEYGPRFVCQGVQVEMEGGYLWRRGQCVKRGDIVIRVDGEVALDVEVDGPDHDLGDGIQTGKTRARNQLARSRAGRLVIIDQHDFQLVRRTGLIPPQQLEVIEGVRALIAARAVNSGAQAAQASAVASEGAAVEVEAAQTLAAEPVEEKGSSKPEAATETSASGIQASAVQASAVASEGASAEVEAAKETAATAAAKGQSRAKTKAKTAEDLRKEFLDTIATKPMDTDSVRAAEAILKSRLFKTFPIESFGLSATKNPLNICIARWVETQDLEEKEELLQLAIILWCHGFKYKTNETTAGFVQKLPHELRVIVDPEYKPERGVERQQAASSQAGSASSQETEKDSALFKEILKEIISSNPSFIAKLIEMRLFSQDQIKAILCCVVLTNTDESLKFVSNLLELAHHLPAFKEAQMSALAFLIVTQECDAIYSGMDCGLFDAEVVCDLIVQRPSIVERMICLYDLDLTKLLVEHSKQRHAAACLVYAREMATNGRCDFPMLEVVKRVVGGDADIFTTQCRVILAAVVSVCLRISLSEEPEDIRAADAEMSVKHIQGLRQLHSMLATLPSPEMRVFVAKLVCVIDLKHQPGQISATAQGLVDPIVEAAKDFLRRVKDGEMSFDTFRVNYIALRESQTSAEKKRLTTLASKALAAAVDAQNPEALFYASYFTNPKNDCPERFGCKIESDRSREFAERAVEGGGVNAMCNSGSLELKKPNPDYPEALLFYLKALSANMSDNLTLSLNPYHYVINFFADGHGVHIGITKVQSFQVAIRFLEECRGLLQTTQLADQILQPDKMRMVAEELKRATKETNPEDERKVFGSSSRGDVETSARLAEELLAIREGERTSPNARVSSATASSAGAGAAAASTQARFG